MLKITDVYYRYKSGTKDVLKGINAEFSSGKLYSIMGPSGSGKTTLLSIMAGLDTPSGGSVFFDGENLKNIELNEYRKSKIALIFQQFHLFPMLTALENVSFLMESSGMQRRDAIEKAKDFLSTVGIDDDKFGRYPANLSGGEQQRVAIARALSGNARLILADEPTGNLDEDNGNAVINLLKNLAHDKGYCIIVVTHNSEVAAASDIVYNMRHGLLLVSTCKQAASPFPPWQSTPAYP